MCLLQSILCYFFLLSSPSLVSNSLFSLYPIFEEFQFRCNTMKTRSIPVEIYSGWYCNLINQCFCEWGPIEHYFMIDRCTWNWLTRPWKRVKYNVKVCNPWKKRFRPSFILFKREKKHKYYYFYSLWCFYWCVYNVCHNHRVYWELIYFFNYIPELFTSRNVYLPWKIKDKLSKQKYFFAIKIRIKVISIPIFQVGNIFYYLS